MERVYSYNPEPARDNTPWTSSPLKAESFTWIRPATSRPLGGCSLLLVGRERGRVRCSSCSCSAHSQTGSAALTDHHRLLLHASQWCGRIRDVIMSRAFERVRCARQRWWSDALVIFRFCHLDFDFLQASTTLPYISDKQVRHLEVCLLCRRIRQKNNGDTFSLVGAIDFFYGGLLFTIMSFLCWCHAQQY